ncbi:NADPH oxidase 4-like isoform X1 [Acanthaster planci]|uniref:NADPH oxidase 4-like isoform X1 n=1 Tax=Acanthaster planci TaxID=133434 RepID=A0A8B7ZN03_ACAPL|nr:NADPH oxidase 4-like isoform X1 [Acanthaster planci]
MKHAGAEVPDGRAQETPGSVDYNPTTGKSAAKCRHRRQVRQSGFSPCSWFRNGGFKYLFVVVWTGLNAAVFCWSYMQYKMEAKYYYLRGILGLGLCVSRGSAAVLNLNCATILLPMCRCLLSLIRRSKHVHRTTRKCLDRSRFIHIVIAIYICLGTAVHCVAHFFNAVSFSANYNVNVPDVNVASYLGENPCRIIFTTVPGVTGCLMLLILVAIVLTSCRAVRASRHELFWYCHQFFFVFYALLICHSIRGVLKEQRNTNMHTPGCIDTSIPAAEPEPQSSDWSEHESRNLLMKFNSTMVCEEEPAFVPHRSDTWCFLILPAGLYIGERLWRLFRSYRCVTVIGIRFHACDVMELQLHVDQFQAQPGQYVMLRCPIVSRLEWHPFTITRCPSQRNSTFTVHIRIQGDWTCSLRNLLTQDCSPGSGDTECLKLPKIYIDGPFGSPSEDVFRYNTSICIAGGVGVTPFAAVLNSLLEAQPNSTKLRRLYFIWVCRHVKNFEWFMETISQLHQKLWESNRPDVLILRLYVTGGEERDLQGTSAAQKLIFSRVRWGRPDLKQLFSEVTLCNPGSNVGVFVCGPKKLSLRVHKRCNRWNRHKTRLHYNKESFG